MKKITFAFLLFICSQSLFSQIWFDAGLKGGYGVDLLVNNNFYNDRHFSPTISFGYMYGAKVGVNINEKHAVTIDVTSSSFSQSFVYTFASDSTKTQYSRSMGFNAINIMLLYRKTTNASYLEIGPQYSMINNARYSDNFTQEINAGISDKIVKSYYSLVFGCGGFLAGTENFRVNLGFRFSYALNDLISSNGKQINFPSVTNYARYKTSNPFSAMLVMELNLDFGYFMKTKCKKRKTKFLLF